MPRLTFYKAIIQAIMVGVHDRNFKDGAFKSLVPRTTNTNGALKSLLDSPLLSAAEKSDISGLVGEFLTICANFSNGAEPGFKDTMDVNKAMERLMAMFDNDARARGEYVPSQFMMQALNTNNSVPEAQIWDVATQTMRTVQGGVAGFLLELLLDVEEDLRSWLPRLPLEVIPLELRGLQNTQPPQTATARRSRRRRRARRRSPKVNNPDEFPHFELLTSHR